MRLTEKAERRLRYVLVSLVVICLTPLCENGRKLNGAHNSYAFAGKDITCVIDLGDEMYGDHGLETGLNYELLNRFAQDNRCNIDIVAAGKGKNYLDSLKNDKEDELRQINIWISHMAESDEFQKITGRYSGAFNPIRRAEKGVRTSRISPYDDMIRKYAAQLGWDWRMLAAVVYQESKFSINSNSVRGAQGLMQVMPSTARYYGIDDLLDPEKNLIAGTSHLKRLQNMFNRSVPDQTELIKFTLAAYNAGEGRIADCRNFAASRQVDNSRWDEIVKIIPLMREDSILEDESVRLGKFQGHETIAYVERIMSIYEAICTICPEA